MDIITKELFNNQDLDYRNFNSKLIPNINKEKIIGVKTPILRKIAKEIKEKAYIEYFLKELPHTYQEENILHAIILSTKYKDIDTLLNKLDKFLKYVDNWAITDIIIPKLFKKYPDKVYNKIKIWLKDRHEYTVRFAVVSLLKFYLDEHFNKEELDLINNIQSKYFYVNMAIAWFYSFALIKQYDTTITYFENKLLDKWIHNKSLQKAIESYQITKERKAYLRSLKIK